MIHSPPRSTRTRACTYIRDNSEGNKTNKQTKKKVNNAIYTYMKIEHKLCYSFSLGRHVGLYRIVSPSPLPHRECMIVIYVKIKHQLCYSLSLGS